MSDTHLCQGCETSLLEAVEPGQAGDPLLPSTGDWTRLWYKEWSVGLGDKWHEVSAETLGKPQNLQVSVFTAVSETSSHFTAWSLGLSSHMDRFRLTAGVSVCF